MAKQRNTLTLGCPSCTLNSELVPSRAWADGSLTNSYKPRELYGYEQDTLLVSRIYRCKLKNHRILAHDSGVLSQTCNWIQEPFILFHKVGLTRNLYLYFIRQTHLGSAVNEVISLWHQSMYDHFTSKKRMYQNRASFLDSSVDKCLSFPVYRQKGYDAGVKLLVSCTTHDYFSQEVHYSQCGLFGMCQMTATNLSADHTFKVATNIGIVRDGK